MDGGVMKPKPERDGNMKEVKERSTSTKRRRRRKIDRQGWGEKRKGNEKQKKQQRPKT